MSLSTGSKLGSYEIVSPIGAGGMGEVYKAKDTRLDRTVAIKVLPSHLADNPDLKQRFEREARAVSSLNHPHICTLYDIGEQDGTDFLVMEYIEGESLADRLKKGALPLDQALRYAIEIADALDKAHRQGVVHRDLKPGNIMLTKSGAKLLDFGLAKLKALSLAGSLGAIRPPHRREASHRERLHPRHVPVHGSGAARRQGRGRADGHLRFWGGALRDGHGQARPSRGRARRVLIAAIMEQRSAAAVHAAVDVTAALDHVAARCLAKDPDDRWQSASDLMGELKWSRRVVRVG